MNGPPLTYFPAYLGLLASLMLAMACNAFLDIQYRSFGIELFLWTALFAWTLWTGWRQGGIADERGKRHQKTILILGGILSVIFFIPVWGFPRAGLYLLSILQASMNCVTTSRRQLHLGLLVSAVMVLFAASHYRADWTMLFYLLPYIAAAVFTLVAEQINRRTSDLRQASLGNPTAAGQGMAILAATGAILTLGAALYLATPQVTWPYLAWRYGQPSALGFLGGADDEQDWATRNGARHAGSRSEGDSGQGPGSRQTPEAGQAGGGAGRQQGNGQGLQGLGQRPGQSRPGQGDSGSAYGGTGPGSSGDGQELMPGHGWPTPEQMREAARRPGMPRWQSSAIMGMASADEAIQEALAPLLDKLDSLWNNLKEWLKENRKTALTALLALLLLAALGILFALLREVRALAWLRTRFDYLYLGLLGGQERGNGSVQAYYRAVERLFATRDLPRPPAATAREYLTDISRYWRQDGNEAQEMTRLFEDSRYGRDPASGEEIQRMRALYCQLFRKIG